MGTIYRMDDKTLKIAGGVFLLVTATLLVALGSVGIQFFSSACNRDECIKNIDNVRTRFVVTREENGTCVGSFKPDDDGACGVHIPAPLKTSHPKYHKFFVAFTVIGVLMIFCAGSVLFMGNKNITTEDATNWAKERAQKTFGRSTS